MSEPDVAGLADDHVHSIAGSADAGSTVMELGRRAVARGLCRICVTEHLDFDQELPEYGYYVYETAYRAVETARERFSDRLEIAMGLEVDFETRFLADIARALPHYPVDFLLGAVHVYQGMHFYEIRDEGQSVMTAEALTAFYRHYFSELRALIRHGLVDCVAHLDYPARVGIRSVDGKPASNYADELDETLALAVACGVGMEINTRRARGGTPLAAPGSAVQRYVALGGSIITLGSDTHHCAQLADGLELGRAAILDAGLGAQAVFRRRRAEYLTL